MTGFPELPACRKCGAGMLVPLSDYGRDGAPITFKAWVCSNPECGFNIRIDNGDITFGRPVHALAEVATRPNVPSVRVVSAAESAARDRAAIGAGVPSRALMRAAGMAAATVIGRRFGPPPGARRRGLRRSREQRWRRLGDGCRTGGSWRAGPRCGRRSDPHRRCSCGASGTPTRSSRMDRRSTTKRSSSTACLARGRPAPLVARSPRPSERLRAARARGARVVALDVPSGVDATSGAADGAVHADLTLTFGALKRGLTIARGACGRIVVLDIGLGTSRGAGRRCSRLDRWAVRPRARAPNRCRGEQREPVGGLRSWPPAPAWPVRASSRLTQRSPAASVS